MLSIKKEVLIEEVIGRLDYKVCKHTAYTGMECNRPGIYQYHSMILCQEHVQVLLCEGNDHVTNFLEEEGHYIDRAKAVTVLEGTPLCTACQKKI